MASYIGKQCTEIRLRFSSKFYFDNIACQSRSGLWFNMHLYTVHLYASINIPDPPPPELTDE